MLEIPLSPFLSPLSTKQLPLHLADSCARLHSRDEEGIIPENWAPGLLVSPFLPGVERRQEESIERERKGEVI